MSRTSTVGRAMSFVAFFAVVILVLGGLHYYIWARLVRDTRLPAALGSGAAGRADRARHRVAADAPGDPALARRRADPRLAVLHLAGCVDAALLPAAGDRRRASAASGSETSCARSRRRSISQRRTLVARSVAGVVTAAAGTLTAVALRSALGPVAVKRVPVTLARLPERDERIHVGSAHRHPRWAHHWARIHRNHRRAYKRAQSRLDRHYRRSGRRHRRRAPRFGRAARPAARAPRRLLRHRQPRVLLRRRRPGSPSSRGSAFAACATSASRSATATPASTWPASTTVRARAPASPVTARTWTGRWRRSTRSARSCCWPINRSRCSRPRASASGCRSPATPTAARSGRSATSCACSNRSLPGCTGTRGAQVYVSRGTGYWGPPMRLGAPAEITQLVLTRGNEGFAGRRAETTRRRQRVQTDLNRARLAAAHEADGHALAHVVVGDAGQDLLGGVHLQIVDRGDDVAGAQARAGRRARRRRRGSPPRPRPAARRPAKRPGTDSAPRRARRSSAPPAARG